MGKGKCYFRFDDTLSLTYDGEIRDAPTSATYDSQIKSPTLAGGANESRN